MRSKIAVLILLPLVTLLVGVHQNTKSKVTVVATGDTMLGSWIGDIIEEKGHMYPFVHIKEYLDSADLHITNLEAPFGTRGKPFDKKFTFRVHPDLVHVLRAGSVDIVSLANNHMLDYGPECVEETRQLLDLHEIKYAGAGSNLTVAREAAIEEVNGRRVGFLSYTLTFPEEFWASDTSAGTCFPYESFAFKDVARLKSKTDFVIVACHWGQELRTTPKPYQVKLAHRLINNGADVVLGHHPHVVQGIEFYKGKMIAYSLGNFVFASYSERVKDSMLLQFSLGDEDVMKARIVPINVYNAVVDFQPVPLKGKARTAFLERMKIMSQELNSVPIGINNDGDIEMIVNR
ncbi:MAG: CapA family protein [Calditrichia bacterium]